MGWGTSSNLDATLVSYINLNRNSMQRTTMTHDRHARCAPAAPLPLSPCRRTFPGAPRTTPPTRRRPSSTSALLRAGATVTHRLRNRLRDDRPSTTSSAARHACTDEVRARPAGAATGDVTRAGQAHWPRPRQPRSAGLAAARVRQRDRGGARACRPRSRSCRSCGSGARHGGRDAKGRTPAGRARRPLGRSCCRPRSAGFWVSAGPRGGGCAAASPDTDLSGPRVARGSGRDTGDATRRAGRARRPRGRSRW